MSNPNLPGRPLEHYLLYDFLRVVEAAAIASARTMDKASANSPTTSQSRPCAL